MSSLYCETLLALCRFEPFAVHNADSNVASDFEQKQEFIRYLLLKGSDKDARNDLDLQVS
jgi:hypothetical protein